MRLRDPQSALQYLEDHLPEEPLYLSALKLRGFSPCRLLKVASSREFTRRWRKIASLTRFEYAVGLGRGWPHDYQFAAISRTLSARS